MKRKFYNMHGLFTHLIFSAKQTDQPSISNGGGGRSRSLPNVGIGLKSEEWVE